MGLFNSLFAGPGVRKATEIYSQFSARHRLPAAKEYFAVSAAIEFLATGDVTSALKALEKRAGEYISASHSTAESEAMFDGLNEFIFQSTSADARAQPGNPDIPVMNLFGILHQSISAGGLTKDDALGFLRKKQQEVSKRL